MNAADLRVQVSKICDCVEKCVEKHMHRSSLSCVYRALTDRSMKHIKNIKAHISTELNLWWRYVKLTSVKYLRASAPREWRTCSIVCSDTGGAHFQR